MMVHYLICATGWPCGHAQTLTLQAQYVPQVFWNALPLADLDSWLRAHVPTELSGQLDHGMERARLRLAQRERLVPAADAFLRQTS